MLARNRKLLAIIFLCPPGICFAGQPSPLPPQFTLSRYIPADFWFVANSVPNPKSEWIRNQWLRVADALAASGIGNDIISIVSTLTGWEETGEDGLGPEQLLKLLRGVQWCDMLNGEIAVAERMRRGSLNYEYVMLAKSSPDEARKNMAALVKIFQALSETRDELRVTHKQQRGIDQWLLRAAQPAHYGEGDFKLTLIKKDDIVGLILGSQARKEVLSLIADKPGARSILQSPRFIEAFSQVDAPEDSYTFFDARMLIDDIRIAAMKRIKQEGKSENESPAIPIVKAALKLVDIYDYMLTSTRTEGMQQHVQMVTRIQPDKKRAPLARMIYDQRPIKQFDRYIPADVLSFSIGSHVDVSRGYHLIRHFVAEHVPDGVGKLSKFDDMLETMGFNFDRDILSWLSGETMNVTLPASAPTPMSQYDNVLFIRVKDPEVAYEKVNEALTFATNKLREIGQPVFVRQVDTPNGQCCEVVHPLLAMIGRPVIGVADNWLYISNSVDSVNRCMAVSRGEAPSVLKNKRFIDEGIIPPGPVRSISFTDRRHFGLELARQVAAINQLGAVIPSLLLKQHEQSPADDLQKKIQHVQLVTHLMGAMSKLPLVLKQINFYSSESSYCTFDGQYSRSQGLITYRNPVEELSDEPSAVNVEVVVTP